jgi:thiol-disulfide isomerase/thioredoxin/RNA polymerase subunit RPABC4/transcription elongation factor Spt4
MPSSITCQRCRALNEPFATACQNCGARFCPSCKLVIDSASARVCPHCGKTDLTFKPGKFTGSTFVAAGVAGAPASQTYCSNCGSRIEPGARKCPYCGRLGNIVTQTPQQGYGVMKPAHGGPAYGYSAPEPEPQVNTQKVCAKCGTAIPPGSSLCPIHGKFGGGSTLSESTGPLMPGRHTGDLWRKIEEKRAASAAAEQTRGQGRRMPPEDNYPQMGPGPVAPQSSVQQPEMQEQRICPNCGAPVPDRSKVCPNCGWNRLPPQRGRPIMKAEEYYKAREAVAQPYTEYMPQPDPYYGQPAMQPAQPYEVAYPAPMPGFIEEIKPEKKRKKEKRPREEAYPRPGAGQKKSPWPMLLALLALTGVIIIAGVLIMDMLKAPPAPGLPTSTNPGTVVPKAPVISAIQFKDIGKTSATVTWTTDKKSNSIVVYCLEGGTLCENAKDDALVTGHSITMTDLEQGKAYHITVKSMINDVDSSMDAPYVLRTSEGADTTPPKISDVKVVNLVSSSMGSSATVTWTTDKPATSQVSYGTSGGYGTLQPEQTDTTLIKSHDVKLQGLPTQVTIHYKVVSRDAAGNEASSSDATFMTPPPAGTGIGNAAPDFTLPCADGTTVTLSSLKGSKVIVNFWHTNCGPCREEMPLLEQMQEAHPNLPMLVIHGTALGHIPSDNVVSFVQNSGYKFKVPIDDAGQVSSAYSISSVPTTFFLDATGIIRKVQVGSFSGLSQIEGTLSSY